MKQQITDTLLMIRPVAFHKNEQTAVNNYYQKSIDDLDESDIQKQALQEFDEFVEKLRESGVRVIVFEDTADPQTPDSIFPNNWVSFHDSGDIILYPMYAENRRLERRDDILEAIGQEFQVSDQKDLTQWERQGLYLEGTGSLILDRQNRLAYAAISERTHPKLLEEFEQLTGYKTVLFSANQSVSGKRMPIYHTNVMMCLGESFAVLCGESIDDPAELQNVINTLEESGKEVVLISEEQKERFAGNMLQVSSESGKKYVVMSESAYMVLSDEQKMTLSNHGELLYSPLDTIEALGGGSARCMMAEVFLPKK